MSASARRAARALALQVLYARDTARDTDVTSAVVAWPQEFELDGDLGERAFSTQLVEAAVARADEIDQAISTSSKNWRLDRMAKVDRNILRLATAELLAVPSTPVRVLINEAVELGKQFGTADSPAFINGVLDRVVHTLGRDANS